MFHPQVKPNEEDVQPTTMATNNDKPCTSSSLMTGNVLPTSTTVVKAPRKKTELEILAEHSGIVENLGETNNMNLRSGNIIDTTPHHSKPNVVTNSKKKSSSSSSSPSPPPPIQPTKHWKKTERFLRSFNYNNELVYDIDNETNVITRTHQIMSSSSQFIQYEEPTTLVENTSEFRSMKITIKRCFIDNDDNDNAVKDNADKDKDNRDKDSKNPSSLPLPFYIKSYQDFVKVMHLAFEGNIFDNDDEISEQGAQKRIKKSKGTKGIKGEKGVKGATTMKTKEEHIEQNLLNGIQGKKFSYRTHCTDRLFKFLIFTKYEAKVQRNQIDFFITSTLSENLNMKRSFTSTISSKTSNHQILDQNWYHIIKENLEKVANEECLTLAKDYEKKCERIERIIQHGKYQKFLEKKRYESLRKKSFDQIL